MNAVVALCDAIEADASTVLTTSSSSSSSSREHQQSPQRKRRRQQLDGGRRRVEQQRRRGEERRESDQLSRSEAALDRLRRQLKYLSDENTRLTQERAEEAEQAEQARLAAEALTRGLRDKLAAQRAAAQEIAGQTQTLERKAGRLEAEKEDKDAQLEALEEEMAALRRSQERGRQKYRASLEEIKQLKKRRGRGASDVFTAAAGGGGGGGGGGGLAELKERHAIQVTALERKCRAATACVRALEEEAAREAAAAATGREREKQLEAKLARAKEAATTNVSAVVERDEAIAQAAEWSKQLAQAMGPSGGASGAAASVAPMAVVARIRELQQAHVVAVDETGKCRAEIARLKAALAESKAETAAQRQAVGRAEKGREDLARQLQRSERHGALSSRDASSLRSVLDGWYKSMDTDPNSDKGCPDLAIAKERIKQLEALVDESQAEVRKLSVHLDRSEREVSRLEARVGKGEFNAKTTKVLHFTMNPSRIAMDKAKAAEAADSDGAAAAAAGSVATKQQLATLVGAVHTHIVALAQAVEVERAHLGPGGPTAEQARHMAKLNQLHSQLLAMAVHDGKSMLPNVPTPTPTPTPQTSAAAPGGATAGGANTNASMSASMIMGDDKDTKDFRKRYERLKELFKDKMRQYRECVYLLSGWKIDMYNEKPVRLRLRSMFAESAEDNLLFVKNGKKLDMLATKFASSEVVKQNINTCLKRFDSIPAFLSNVNLQLFEQQTLL